MPGVHFLSPIDLTFTPLVATCELKAHADLVELSEYYVTGLLRALQFLVSLP